MKPFSIMFKTVKNKRGFSIMELMFAVFVLTIGIIGALQLISSTIRNSIDTRNSAIATGLAQEGVELVRNIRDNNMLYVLADLSRDREDYFKSRGFPPTDLNCLFDYTFNYSSPTIACGADDTSAKVYLNSSGFYTHISAGNTETIYRRYVTFVYDNAGATSLNPAPTGVDITSYVWWGSASKPATCNLASKCISVSDYLPKRD